MYQHDIRENHLQTKLENVVSLCVSKVGIDINTGIFKCKYGLWCNVNNNNNNIKYKLQTTNYKASIYLIEKVSGMTTCKAKAIYNYREHKKRSSNNNKGFDTISELLNIKGIFVIE